MKYDLDGKVFRSVKNTENGDVGAETLFHYRQAGAVVSANYRGGSIISGQLLGKVLDDGTLDIRYHHLNSKGEFMLGKCMSAPELLPDGRMKFRESWQWLSGDMSSGQSEIEEIKDVEQDAWTATTQSCGRG